eukprot:6413690-Ditylum_brightwellii.AAC.1
MAYYVYFSLAHYLVLDKDPESDYLLYNYAESVISEKGDVDSKVARDWSNLFKNVVVNSYNHYKKQYGEDNNTLKKKNQIFGGYPPSVQDITTNAKKISQF